jgi:hypothetical protein
MHELCVKGTAFLLASRDDPGLRRSVLGLGAGTGVAISLLVAGSFLEPGPQTAVWGFALALDWASRTCSALRWKRPGHFADGRPDRHHRPCFDRRDRGRRRTTLTWGRCGDAGNRAARW